FAFQGTNDRIGLQSLTRRSIVTVQDLARRIEKLEQTIAELSGARGRTGAWYVEHAGQFKADPVYDEIVRRGRAYRRSLRPAVGSNGRRTKGKAKQRGGKR